MKILKYLILVIFLISLFTACSTKSPISNSSLPSIKKESYLLFKGKNPRYPIYPVLNGWGSARTVDIQAVALSVASTILPYFSEKSLNTIIIKNEKAGPRILYERGVNNEYIILVDIKGRRWAQFSYQFSHELGHILSNYSNKSGKNQWFEETMGEVLSLYTLEKMSIIWEHNPPYENWKNYASALKKYLDDMLNEKHRIVKTDLSTWFHKYENTLRSDPYIRDKNEVVATAIYRLIQEDKFKISSIQYLNLGIPNKDKPFSIYLREWYENVSDENRESVLNVIKLLGVTL